MQRPPVHVFPHGKYRVYHRAARLYLKSTAGGSVGFDFTGEKDGRPVIFPSLSDDILTVKSKNNENIGILSIFDIYGRQMAVNREGSTIRKIDVSSLPKGIYFVRLSDQKANLVGKFVRN